MKNIKLILALLITTMLISCANTNNAEKTEKSLMEHGFKSFVTIKNNSANKLDISRDGIKLIFKFKDDKITKIEFTNKDVNDAVYIIDEDMTSKQEKELKKSLDIILDEMKIDLDTIMEYAKWKYVNFSKDLDPM